MDDLEIIKQLMNGNHLEPKEIDRADKLLKSLEVQLKSRIKPKEKPIRESQGEMI